MKKAIFGKAILLLLATVSFGQDAAKKFVSADGGFKLNMPAKYNSTEQELTNDRAIGVDGAGRSYLWESLPISSTRATYLFLTKQKGPLTAADKMKLLSDLKQGILQGGGQLDVQASEKEYAFQNNKGFELTIKVPQRTALMRAFVVGRRMYSLIIIFPSSLDVPQFSAILDSFALLNKEELIAAKIARRTPAELPQTPRPAKAATDLWDEGLKGKVKSVIEDSEEPKISRERAVEKYYNPDGFLLKTIEFNEDYPNTITLWGNVGGKRAANKGYIEFDEDQRPPLRVQNIMETPPDIPAAISGGAGEPPPAAEKSAYDERYEYKYDEQKRIIEKLSYDSDDKSFSRSIFKYSAGRIEETGLETSGDELFHRISILDKDGNVIEDYFLDEKKVPFDRYLYEYQFDAQGNWIVKREFVKKTLKGKPVRKLLRTLYRTITYYS